MDQFPSYDQIMRQNIVISNVPDKELSYKVIIDFPEDTILLYQVWDQKTVNQNSKNSRNYFNLPLKYYITNFFLPNNKSKNFTPTTVIEIGNNKYVSVMYDASISKEDNKCIFYFDNSIIKNSLPLPIGKFSNVRFDIDDIVFGNSIITAISEIYCNLQALALTSPSQLILLLYDPGYNTNISLNTIQQLTNQPVLYTSDTAQPLLPTVTVLSKLLDLTNGFTYSNSYIIDPQLPPDYVCQENGIYFNRGVFYSVKIPFSNPNCKTPIQGYIYINPGTNNCILWWNDSSFDSLTTACGLFIGGVSFVGGIYFDSGPVPSVLTNTYTQGNVINITYTI